MLTLENYILNRAGKYVDDRAIQIHLEAKWYQILPAERCCFCTVQTRYWSTKKKVPVCPDCANCYEESAVPDRNEWRDLP